MQNSLLLTGEVLVAMSKMLHTEAVLGRARPSDLHTVFRPVSSRSRRNEAFDVLQCQAERPHRRRVRPGIMHSPETVLTRAGPYWFHLYRAKEAERVGGHPLVNAARVVVAVADECRQRVAGTRAVVHGGDGTPRFRVVVRHDEDRRLRWAAAAARETETETDQQRRRRVTTSAT